MVRELARRLRIFLAPLLVLIWLPLAAQDELMEESLRELELYQADLHGYEAEGIYHGSQLIEPLSRIAERFMELGRFTEANATLDRAQQILRIEEGLYTKKQLPFLHRKIENLANAGNWREARKLQDHIIWFYLNKYAGQDQSMMRGMLELSQIHMRGITEDHEENQSYHYLRAAYSSRVALNVADNIWPRQEQRKSGLIYEQLRIMYLQASAIRKGGQAAQNMRISPSSLGSNGQFYEYIMSPETVLIQLRVNGMHYLERLRQIYAGEEEDDEAAEALAMVKLYQADWLLLFDRKIQALEAYREASAMLLQAGVPPAAVDGLFAKPALIPEPVFHQSVVKALAARSRGPLDAPAAFAQGMPVKIFYEDWPLSPETLSMEQFGLLETTDSQTVALFSFDLPAKGEIETKSGWRRKNAFGVAQNLALIQLEEFPVYQETEPLIRSLGRLRFRPGLTAGEPHAANGVISYLISSE